LEISASAMGSPKRCELKSRLLLSLKILRCCQLVQRDDTSLGEDEKSVLVGCARTSSGPLQCGLWLCYHDEHRRVPKHLIVNVVMLDQSTGTRSMVKALINTPYGEPRFYAL
jgi:hypothetical protein